MKLRIGKPIMLLCFVLFAFPFYSIVAQYNNAPPSPERPIAQLPRFLGT